MPIQLIAANDLDLDESDRLFEEVDGQLVEMPPMSFFANWIAGRIFSRLDAYCTGTDFGFATIECLFHLAMPVHRNRRPDVAVVSWRRWPKDRPLPRTGNALDVTPNLMVEVISPTDLAEAVIEKVGEYFQAGAEQVWLVYPSQSRLQIFASPTSSRWLTRDDVIADLPFLPGFQFALREIFPEDPGATRS
jgi:Uma2 family endonuclease